MAGWAGRISVNAGRGGLQVEADILAALEAGALKGATLDVFETEPLPVESPLWKHPAVTVTPHNSAMSEPLAVATLIATQIRRHQAGEPLEHLVDPGPRGIEGGRSENAGFMQRSQSCRGAANLDCQERAIASRPGASPCAFPSLPPC